MMTPILQFSTGDPKGFDYFFKEFYRQLLAYAIRFIRDKPSSEDIVEESFIKAWENRAAYTHELQLRSWLYTTVRNRCLNKIHKEQIDARRLKKYHPPEIEQPVIHHIIQSEFAAEMHRAIDLLPTQCRKIFKLLYIDGLTVRDIVDRYGMNISTVKNQKARGLGLLRARMCAR